MVKINGTCNGNNKEFELQGYGRNTLFYFFSWSGKKYWNDGGGFNRPVGIHYYVGNSDILSLSNNPTLLAKVRRIFNLNDNEFIDVDTYFPNYTNLWEYSYSTNNRVSTFTESYQVLNMSLEVDNEFPLVITSDFCNFLTYNKPSGRTVEQPLMEETYSGSEYQADKLTSKCFINPNTVVEGTELINPYESNSFLVNGFGDIDLGVHVNLNRARGRFILEYLLEDVNSYEELKLKFYQTPLTPRISYNQEFNANNNILSGSTTLDQRLIGIDLYEDNVLSQVYTEFNGVKLNQPTLGLNGEGTGYEVHLKAVNSSGNVVNDVVLDTIDNPTEYPYTKTFNNLSMLGVTGAYKDSYKIYVYLVSKHINYTLSLSGNSLIQNRDYIENISTESDNSVFYTISYPFKDTPIEPTESNLLQIDTKFTETLNITIKKVEKEPKKPIPDTPLVNFTGFNKVYKLSGIDVINFNGWLWGTDLQTTHMDLSTLKKVNNNPIDNLLFLKASPFDLESGSSYPITIGNLSYTETEFPKVDTFSKIKIGDIQLQRYYSDYRDFRPFTTFRMYLPFVGFVDLEPKQMYNEKCTLNIIINSDTFDSVYDLRRDSDNMVIGQWSCNVGIDCPLTSSNLTEGVVNSALSGFKTAATTLDNPYGGFDSLIDTVNTVAKVGNQTSHSNPSANMSMGLNRWCYIEVVTMNYNEPINYGHSVGFPCNKTLKLGDCKGFTVVKNIDLHNFDYPKEFIEKLENELANGFIL